MQTDQELTNETGSELEISSIPFQPTFNKDRALSVARSIDPLQVDKELFEFEASSEASE